MTISRDVQPSRRRERFTAVGRRAVISGFVVAAGSFAGALVFPLSSFGRTGLGSVSKEWLLLLLAAWAILLVWALLYSLLLHRLLGLSTEQSLYRAALCHTPLLLSLSLASALYSSDLANHIYSDSAYGRVIFQPIARWSVIVTPAVAQGLLLAASRPHLMVRALPLATVTLGALAMRLWNLNWGLPALTHPDEHHYIGLGTVMASSGDLNPHYFQNPSLLIYMDTVLARLLSQQAQAFHVIADFLGLGVMDPRGDYLVDVAARAVSALGGTLTVVVVYLTGRELFGRRAGLLSACLLAASLLHTRNSHYATNDVLATFFLALSFLYSARIYTESRLSNYLLAGVFGGLAAGTKYNVALFAVGILVAHLVRNHQLGTPRMCASDAPAAARSGLACAPWTYLLTSGTISIVAFLGVTPYALLDFEHFAADFRAQYAFGANPWSGQEQQPPLLLYAAILARGLGVIPLGLAALGLLLEGKAAWHRLALVASVPAAYLLFMSTQQLVFARFAIPLLPFLSLLAGSAIDRLGSIQTWGRVATVVLLASALIQPLALSTWHNVLLGREDTRALATDWIQVNIPTEATLAVEDSMRMSSPFEWRSSQLRDTRVFSPSDPQDTAEILRGDFDYVAISSSGYHSWWRVHDPSQGLPPLYQKLDRQGRLVALFEPGPGNSEVSYAMDDLLTPFWHLFSRERPGPEVRIYRMERER